MSVIVKEMQMPESCRECRFYNINSACFATKYFVLLKKGEKKPSWCPLVEIPEGHGRLIDESKLERNTVIAYEPYCGEMMNNHREIAVFDDEIKNAPTILEAEVTK